MPKISVIIPVYQVENFIEKCMTTVISQTFTDFEVIAVNDGSPDRCPEILHRFAKAYNFITVIDQENQGLSAARNAGLRMARGEYICFIDGDDYVSPYFLEELYRAVSQNHADIACCYFYYHFVISDVLYKYPFRCEGVFNSAKAVDLLLRDVKIQSFMWNKIFRRSLFTDNEIDFPSMAFEDMAVSHRLFRCANKVAVINKALYYYNQQSGSILATMNANKINDFIRATTMVRVSLEQANTFEHYRKSYHALMRKTCFCCYYFIFRMHWMQKKPAGFFHNLKKVTQAVFYYGGKRFDSDAFSEEIAPHVVSTPGRKKERTLNGEL